MQQNVASTHPCSLVVGGGQIENVKKLEKEKAKNKWSDTMKWHDKKLNTIIWTHSDSGGEGGHNIAGGL